MGIDVSIKIGGAAGQGIQTVGDLLAEVARNSGLYIMAMNDFESRIRGGHSFFQIRISDQPVMAPHHRVHLLVSLDKVTYDLHHQQLVEGGLAINDSGEESGADIINVPVTELASQAGGRVMANTVAAGAILGLAGAAFESFKSILEKRFLKKGQSVVDNNLKAAEAGFQAVAGKTFKHAFDWNQSSEKRPLINGSKSVALGALAGDCRLAAFYPMSPATDIMSSLIPYTKNFPLVVEQVEDELAAVNMVLGASYTGVRAITATSGGGFCLMVEGLGLSGITETPLVIVNSQRPGPATGLPTRTAQADLMFVIFASQDEFPRFVFAPGTPEEAFEKTRLAFHLSEKYQVPAIVLTDEYFNDSIFIAEKPFEVSETIDRFTVADKDIADPENYERYAVTETGISPRALPCQGKALVMASGNEHTPDGHLSEDPHNRKIMVEKRAAKLPAMIAEMQAPEAYYPDASILLVGFGSTKGAIREALELLRNENYDVGYLHFTDLWPFPTEKVQNLLKDNKRFICVEQNSTAQLGKLIRMQTGLSHFRTVLKYDGRPFFPIEIVEDVKKIME
ncbi:MAG: 2-oxoacid:acceptor oxidoreductase subunit alpha [Proteobacteria bacterium]|nr:2-oxoacid:acceptor oxidoreductase subunit alpha [Pseudomonadota bacterium]